MVGGGVGDEGGGGEGAAVGWCVLWRRRRLRLCVGGRCRWLGAV